eukprot:gene10443-biopygen13846
MTGNSGDFGGSVQVPENRGKLSEMTGKVAVGGKWRKVEGSGGNVEENYGETDARTGRQARQGRPGRQARPHRPSTQTPPIPHHNTLSFYSHC